MSVKTKRGPASATSQTIIDGALSIMVEDGLARLTTKSVSERADVSTAAIHYFFETKDNLIYSAFVHVIRTTRSALMDVRRAESDPITRIRRSLDVFFRSGRVSAEESKIWPELWVHAGSDDKTRRLFCIYNSRLISNFTHDLVCLGVDRARARLLALKFNALHRGLWIEQQIGQRMGADECTAILDSIMDEVGLHTSKMDPSNTDPTNTDQSTGAARSLQGTLA